MKLNYKRTVLIGLAFLSINAFWQLYDNVIPLILKNTFHLGETITGVIMAADNLLALFLLPLFGILSDRITTRIGKRMPFILLGTSLSACFMLVLPLADLMEQLPLFITALFCVLLSMGLYRSPAVALMPDLTPRPLRSKGNAVINLCGAVGGVYTLVMIKTLVGEGLTPNYYPLFLSVIVLMVGCITVLFFTVQEPLLRRQMPEEDEPETICNKAKLPKKERRSLVFLLLSVALWYIAYNAVTSAFSRYATHVWGLDGGGYADCLMVATVSAIISYIPIGFLSSHFGRKNTILGGIVLMGAAYLAAALFNNYHPVMNLLFALVGFGWAAISVNSLPMVLEIASAGDVGKYTGYYYTFAMAAQVITPIFSGFLLEHLSYRTLFPYSAVFSALAFLTMYHVRHGDAKPLPKKTVLESFDVED